MEATERPTTAATDSQSAELFALMAFYEGVIDASQLRKMLRKWVTDDSLRMDELLLRDGTVSQQEFRGIQGLVADLAASGSEPELAAFPEDTPTLPMHDESADLIFTPKKRNKKKHRQASVDYYDSIHQHFTQDDRLLPSFSRQYRSLRRRFRQSVFQFGRSTANIAEMLWRWLTINRKVVSISTAGLATFFVCFYFLASWIKPTASPRSTTARIEQSEASGMLEPAAAAAAVEPGPANLNRLSSSPATTEEDAPIVTSFTSGESLPNGAASVEFVAGSDLPDAPALSAQPAAGINPQNAGEVARSIPSQPEESVGPEESGDSVADAIVLHQPEELDAGADAGADALPTNELPVEALENESDVVATVSSKESHSSAFLDELFSEPGIDQSLMSRGDGDESREVRALLNDVSMLLGTEDVKSASKLLSSRIAADPELDCSQTQLALAAVHLAAKNYGLAGEVLAQPVLAELGGAEWELLLAGWLLHAQEDSKESMKAALAELTPQRSLRFLAWIEARNRNHTTALVTLNSLGRDATFGDALYRSVALNYAGRKSDARKSLQQALLLFEIQSQDTHETVPKKVGGEMIQRALEAYGNVLQQ